MKAKDVFNFEGKNALSNADLLSLMIGVPEKTAKAVYDYADENYGGNFGLMEVHDFTTIDGIGESKAVAMVAGMELYKRLHSNNAIRRGERLRDSRQVAEMLMEDLRDERREVFMAINLDTKLHFLSKHTISIGTLDSSLVHPREVFGPAIRRGAAAVIVAHNHPSSGDPTPSPEDIAATKRLIEASNVLGIRLLDHVIIGDRVYTSMKADGFFDA